MLRNVETDNQELVLSNNIERSRIFTKKRAALGLTAVLLAQNADSFLDLYSYKLGGGDMTPEVSGCEYMPPPTLPPVPTTEAKPKPQDLPDTTTTTTTNPTEEIEITASKKVSSSSNNSTLQIIKNLPEFFDQKDDMYKHIDKTFVSEYSGIRFEIYKTEEVSQRQINEEALDELFHLSLTTEIEHLDPKKKQLMDCVKSKVLYEKELAGRIVKILIRALLITV